jgi:L,D-peptidoglycan transpeptidase YkuD (ErfK/YbiS/YcfS/YnhG family)
LSLLQRALAWGKSQAMTSNRLIATPSGPDPWNATVAFRSRRLRASIGRSGVTRDKREGDGASPAGTWPMRRLFFRPDRVTPKTVLPIQEIRPEDGWCDDPAKPEYNRLVRLPFAGGHEEMWMESGLYDLVVELGYNDDPPVAGKGSAIFLHVIRPDFGATAGCLALPREDLLSVLAEIGPGAAVEFRCA